MLIPRYTIRWLLGLMTFSAGVSLVLSYAVRGHAWALAMTSMLWLAVVLAVLFVTAFLVAWLIDQLSTDGSHRRKGGSPFAPPGIALPQIAPPAPPDSPPPMTG